MNEKNFTIEVYTDGVSMCIEDFEFLLDAALSHEDDDLFNYLLEQLEYIQDERNGKIAQG